MKDKKGFTLVELLAVIALLGIIAILVVPNILENYNDAKKSALIDEAKIIYNEATNKYLKEKMNGNKIYNITNENNTLDIEENGVNYTIRIDKDGNVSAMKIKKGKYCIAGTGDFVLDMGVEDVITLSDDIEGFCDDNTLMDGEVISISLKVKNTSRPIINDVIPDVIYLKYNQGWYDKETTKGKSITSVDTIPSKRNFYFGGYKLSPDDKLIIDYSGKILLDNKGYIGEELVLNSINQNNSKAYASFDKKYYKAKLSANSGVGEDNIVLVNYGDNVKLPKNTFTKVGYTFTGWKNTFGESFNDEDDLVYIDDDNENDLPNYRFNANKVIGSNEDNIVTFNAQWQANTYNIVFNPNGGSVSPTNKNVVFDSAVGSLPIPSYAGYTFDGWYTSSTGGTKITESTIYKTPNNSTYYARYITCPAGSYCPGGNQIFTCAAGTYAVEGATSCTTCNNGYYTNTGNSTGASTCTKCEAGNSCNGKTKTPCAAGTYALAGATSCTTCNNGYYTNTGNSTGASTCTKCEAGNYCNGKIKTPCAAGTYAVAGATSCTTCNNGYYTDKGNNTGATTCTKCEAGNYCNGKIKTPCAAGTYAVAGASSCNTCNSGYYTNTGNNTGASTCTKCEAGNSCNGKTKTTCSAGSYSLAGASTCTSCVVGSYNSSAGSSSCSACAKGKTTSSTGSTSCGVNCSNSSNVSSWNTPSWSNNAMSNLCSVSGCNTGYHLSSNSCAANTYSIAYNSNGGSGSMSNTSCTYGSNCTLRSNSFSRTDYDFLGWSTSSSATSATYSNGVNVSNLTSTNNGSVTLYAVWKQRCSEGTWTLTRKCSSNGWYKETRDNTCLGRTETRESSSPCYYWFDDSYGTCRASCTRKVKDYYYYGGEEVIESYTEDCTGGKCVDDDDDGGGGGGGGSSSSTSCDSHYDSYSFYTSKSTCKANGYSSGECYSYKTGDEAYCCYCCNGTDSNGCRTRWDGLGGCENY